MPSPHFLSLHRALICSALLYPALDSASARAAEIGAAGVENGAEAVRPLSQREFVEAATPQIEFLKELRAWRDTLRGSGARREWGFSPLRGEKLALSLGNVAPSPLGGGAGLAAKWKRLEIGTTAQPQSVDEALARFDSLLTGEKMRSQSEAPTQFHWLRAQLSDSPGAQIEAMAARASRDFASPDSATPDSRWRGADFQSARARFRLPAKWSLSGDFGRAAVERGGEKGAANAWGVEAAGPLSHPFGVANLRANWRAVGDGYLAPMAENGAVGAENGTLEVAQNVQIGALSGQLNFGALAGRRSEVETARAGEELARNQAQSTAQMRLALSPNFSVTGNGQWSASAATRALSDQQNLEATKNEALWSESLSPAQAIELSRQLAGDIGVQWNFSKALSLAVSLGISRQNLQIENDEIRTFGPQSDEVRRALEVRQNSGAGDFRLRFSQRARPISASTAPLQPGQINGSAVSQWRIEAARALVGSVRLKTILDFASDAAKGQSARRIEAQLQLARAARLDARYRVGNFAPGLLSDEWSSVFAASGGANKEWSARFGAGSAASGAGLGLALEMVRKQGDLPDSYRVGVQFK